MMISLELLLKKLCLQNLIIQNPSGHSYLMAIHNETGVNLYDDRIIHLMTVQEYENAGYPCIPGALFLFEIPSDFSVSYTSVQSDIVFFPELLIEDVLSHIREIISEYQRFLKYKIKLETLIKRNVSLKDFFTLFSSYFNNPVAFGDSGGNIIYMENLREDFHDYDETLNYWITHGYIPYEFSKNNGNIEMTSLWQKSSVPVLMNTGFAEKYSRLSYRTCKNNRVYNNYFSIVEVYEKYQYFDEDVLILTGDYVSDYYANHTFPEIELPKAKFLRKVISLESDPDPLLVEQAKQFNLLTPTIKSVVILVGSDRIQETNSNEIKTTNTRNHVKSSLSHVQPPILYFEETERMVLLLEATSEENLKQAELKLRRKLQNNILMSCSCCFENIFKAHSMYQKALLTIEAGKTLYPNSNFFHFEDMYFETILYILYKNNLLSCFIIDGMEELEEYDRKKHTEFSQTLQEYLLCDKNIANLSKTLHIHRNTALYRLEKATEWLKTDLNDYESTARLFLSFAALDILKHMKK